jgi:hypothetical protein
MKHQMPKTLIVDIETSYMKVVSWRPGEQFISKEQILEDWSIISWSAKWRGQKKIIYRDTSKQKNKRDDSKILPELWDLMDQADIVVGQNSRRFDVPKIFARFIINEIQKGQPPGEFRQQDTMKMGKKFGFSSHSLAYMSKVLNLKHQKLVKREFEGLDLWLECLEKDNPRAWAEMKKYNPQDVLATEELYEKLLAWDNSINFNTYHKMHDNVCGCGSTEFLKDGWRNTNAGRYQKFRCVKCGKSHKAKHNELSEKKRDRMLR